MKKILSIAFLSTLITGYSQSDYYCDSIVKDLNDLNSHYFYNQIKTKYPSTQITHGLAVLDTNSSLAVKSSFKTKQTGVFGPFLNADNSISYIKVFELGEDTLMNMNYILLHKGAGVEKKADSLLEEIFNGESFESIASKYSLDPGKYNGGKFGWFIKGQIVSSIEDGINNHENGDVFNVETREYGWYIIEVVETAKKRQYIEYIEVKINNCL